MSINESTISAQDADRVQEISRELDKMVLEIDKNNRKLKELEKSKDSLRSHFFSLVNEYIEKSGTAENQVVYEKCASRAQAESYVHDNFPGWRLIQYKPDQLVIEEDPAQMRFTWTTEDGYQISRTTAVVGTQFDYDKLHDTDRELFEQIVDMKITYVLDEKKAQSIIEERPEVLPILQESTKLGKVQLRMSSPKKVVDE